MITFTQCKQLAANYGDDIRAAMDVITDQPEWLYLNGEPLDIYDIASIQQGGCASGSHMDAVTYHKAALTMNEHGDDVLSYLEDIGVDPSDIGPFKGGSWYGAAVIFLSTAIESWCYGIDLEGVDV